MSRPVRRAPSWIIALAALTTTAWACGGAPGAIEVPRSQAPPSAAGFDAPPRFVERAGRFVGATASYRAEVGTDGLSFAPGGATISAALVFERSRISGGVGAERAPVLSDPAAVSYESSSVREELRLSGDGIEQSWRFSTAPPRTNGIRITIRVHGQEYAGATTTGLHFRDPRSGRGVRYGKATWIDAAGRRTDVRPRYERDAIIIDVDAAVVMRAHFPVVLDPLISPEVGIDQPIYGPAGYQAARPCATFNGTDFLVAWWRQTSTIGGDAVAARVRPDGTLLDPLGIFLWPNGWSTTG